MTERRIGYAGLDHHHAEPYLQTLSSLPGAVTCACEPNPSFDATIAPLQDVPVYDDVVTMLDEEALDAVFLTLPNRDTPSAIERALDAGVDVFTEKPAARCANELEPLLERVEAADETVCVSYPWQTHPISQELEELVADGFFGSIRAFEARFVASQLAFRDTSHFIFDADASRGGILQWLGIHWIQLLSWLLDDPVTRVNASMDASNEHVDVEDAAILQLETTGGTTGTLHCGYHLAAGTYDTQIDIYGSDGRSSWDPIGRTFDFDGETTLELDDVSGDWASTPHRTITHEYEGAPGYGGMWGRTFIESFFDACDDSHDPPCTLTNAIEVLRILDAAYESADASAWVDVEQA